MRVQLPWEFPNEHTTCRSCRVARPTLRGKNPDSSRTQTHDHWENTQFSPHWTTESDRQVDATKGPAKRGHIVAATLLTRSGFPNVDSFCHAHNICGGHKNGSENLQKHVRTACNNVARFCHGRATSWDTMLPPQCVLSFAGLMLSGEQ